MPKPLFPSFRQPRRGVALIMVLAMLSILLVLAVSFAMSMRTEQQAAGHYADGMKSRSMVPFALTEIIEDLESRHYTAVSPPHYTKVNPGLGSAAPSIKLFPGQLNGVFSASDDAIFPSAGGNAAGFDVENLYKGELTRMADSWLPDTYQTELTPIDAVGWLPLNASFAGERGRVAYIAVNISDHIDPNYLLPMPTGWVNGQPKLPDELIMQTPGGELIADQFDLSNLLDTHRRFYSLKDMVNLAAPATFTYDDPADTDTRMHFYPFSFYPDAPYIADPSTPKFISTNATSEAVAQRAYIGGDDPTRWKNVSIALTAMGLTPAQSAQAKAALEDYMDDDEIPGGTSGDINLGCENNPMYSELMVEIAVTRTGPTNLTFNVRYGAEIWHPFATEFQGARRLDLDLNLSFDNYQSANSDGTWTYANGVVVSDITASQFTAGYNGVLPEQRIITVWDEQQFDDTFDDPGAPPALNFTLAVGNMELESSGTEVDVVEDSDLDAPPGSLAMPDVGRTSALRISWQVIDPRFNHAADSWELFTEAREILGDYNVLDSAPENRNWTDRVAYIKNDISDPDFEGVGHVNKTLIDDNRSVALGTDGGDSFNDDYTMYVADKLLAAAPYNQLFTPGELGYLPIEPWTTLRLYELSTTHRAHPVYTYFTTKPRPVRHSLVNLNTEDRTKLAAAFVNMAVDLYPTDPAALTVVDWAEAERLAQFVIDEGPYLNKSEVLPTVIANITELEAQLGETFTSDLQRESVARNSLEMVGTRQNAFAILCLVEAYANSVNEPVSTAKAAAIVWRDPVPDENGVHPVIIDKIVWLND